MPEKKIRVLLVDDHAIVRRGVGEILESTGRVQVAAEAGDAAMALKYLDDKNIDVILLDINLPDRQGLDIMDQIRESRPDVGILIVSMYPIEQYALRAIKGGASGYLKKDASPDEIIDAVNKVYAGKRYISPEVADLLARSVGKDEDVPAHNRLSSREFQILKLIASGMKLKDIADHLSLSPKTVTTYRTRILEKLELSTNADITLYAKQNSLIY